MKVAIALCVLLVAVSAAPAPEKRFIESIGHLFHQAADALAHTFNQTKDAFNDLTGHLNINFDVVVDALTGLIDSGTTEAACKSTCVSSASAVLGPAASLAGSVCAPVCKAALSKLEETAGK